MALCMKFVMNSGIGMMKRVGGSRFGSEAKDGDPAGTAKGNSTAKVTTNP